MASRTASPGGALLRASRVFSLPPPLPPPMGTLSSQAIFGSDSATLPHPTHQTITTPQASRARGDWGFKRPLPLRATTKTSTPLIRVRAIDTWEQVTDFSSSADHAISLTKWQEMGVPLTVPYKRRNQGPYLSELRKSVFEEDIDSTADGSRHEDHRWKFKGPWLAGQNEGDFNTFIEQTVRKRKLEFQAFLREACAKELTTEARRTATAEGTVEEVPLTVEASDVTEEQFTKYVKTLRQERAALYNLVRSFLDLPPSPSKSMSEYILDQLSQNKPGLNRMESTSPYAQGGPPKTHPSAGLAYSLSAQHIYNHPTWGPQRTKPPVKARVVMPRGASTGNFAPVLGVGGFVVDVPKSAALYDDLRLSERYRRGRRPVIDGLHAIEPDKVGGSKTWVQPSHASVDPKGRVILTVDFANDESVAVLERTTPKTPEPPAPLGPSGVSRSTGFSSLRSGESRGYGLNFSGAGTTRSEAQGAAPSPLRMATKEEARIALEKLLNEER